MTRTITLNGSDWFYFPDKHNKYSKYFDSGSEGSESGGDYFDGFTGYKENINWRPCYIPSVWNTLDPELMRFYGTVFFKKTFPTPIGIEGKSVSLNFGAVNYWAVVWLNGHYLGEHRGGYTPFSFEISRYLNYDKNGRNTLLVMVENEWGHDDRVPWAKKVDWYNYGGIHRDVKLIIRNPVYISDVYAVFTPEFPDDQSPNASEVGVSVEIRIKNITEKGDLGQIILTLTDPVNGGKPIYTKTQPIHTPKQKEESIKITDKIGASAFPNGVIRLWSPETPALYDLTVDYTDVKGNILDRKILKIGLRKIEIRGTSFYLNNRKFIMRGVNRHDDFPLTGAAVPDGVRYADLLIMKRLNINIFRGSHYPNPEIIADMCDSLGLFYVAEIPVYSLNAKMLEVPGVLEDAKNQFAEMFDVFKNHPCLFAWSVSNECDTASEVGRKFHEELYGFVRKLDGNVHPVTHVSNKRLLDICYDLADFITVNIYSGWYSGKFSDLESIIGLMYEIMTEDEDKPFGDPKPIVITEFGAGAIRGYRSIDGAKWSEDFQKNMLEYYIKWASGKDYIGGTWIWMFADTRVDLPQRPDGRPRSYNNKGILDEHRIPKLSFDTVRKLYGEIKEKYGGKD